MAKPKRTAKTARAASEGERAARSKVTVEKKPIQSKPAVVAPSEYAKGPLLDFALTLPEAYEDHPWGESVAKVHKKVFAFFGVGSPARSLSVKLGDNADFALALPCAKPTGYGLGKSGWVSIDLGDESVPPAEVLREWIVESYRHVAPKKLSRAL